MKTNKAAANVPYHTAVASLMNDPRYTDLRDALGTARINASHCPEAWLPRVNALKAEMSALRAQHGLD